MTLQIQVVPTSSLDADQVGGLLDLCRDAYREELAGYLGQIGPGTHCFGRVGGELVSHAMFVPRSLQPAGGPLWRAAYVELVATRPRAERRGYASRLLGELISHMDAFDISALSPSDPALYARLGWEPWRGPLFVRSASGLVPTPGEQVMVRRLPRTPPALDLDRALSVEWRRGEAW